MDSTKTWFFIKLFIISSRFWLYSYILLFSLYFYKQIMNSGN